MTIFRVGLKIRTEGPLQAGLGQFVPVFHRWIQLGRVEGPLVDVADYSHVSDGPRTLLAGFDANLSVERCEDSLDFVWCRKRPTGLTLEETLIQGAKCLVGLCAELEEGSDLPGPISFAGGIVRVFSNDRLLAPNKDSTWEEWQAALHGLARALWGDGPVVEVRRESIDPRERFGVVMLSASKATARDLDVRLGRLPAPE